VSARRIVLAVPALALALAAGGCDPAGSGKPPFHGTDVTGMQAGGALRLDDSQGKPRTLADYRGKVVAVTFGYTDCPDVCPTTLHDWAEAMKKLGPEAARVQFLFVSVDPARDTPARLREYVQAFDPSFVGLRGDAGATEAAAKDFHVYVENQPGRTADTYTVNHSSQVFVFDPAGKLRLIEAAGTAPADIAADVRALLA
jgi:protein SCO1/2